MANNKFQHKRSIVSGVVPTTSDLSPAELGINLADKKLFTANSSAVFELGSNLTNLSVTSNLTVKAIVANGGLGTSGQVLTSNGSGVYWSTVTGGSGFTNGSSISVNNFVVTGAFTANGSTTASFTSNVDIDSSLSIGGTLSVTGNAEFNSSLDIKTYVESEVSPTISTGTLTLDLANSTIFDVSLNDAITTLTLTNVPSTASRAVSFVLVFTADGTPRAVTWPNSFRWPGNTAPTITSTNGKRDVYSFMSTDNGTSWNAFISGQNI